MRPSWKQALLLQGPALLVVTVLLLLPGGVLLLQSFSTGLPFIIHIGGWTTSNYVHVLSDPSHQTELKRSLFIGVQTTIWSTVGGYLLAYWIAFRAKNRDFWLLLVAMSLIASYIVRIYAWRTLLSQNGIVATALSVLRLASGRQSVLLFTPTAVIVAQVQVFLPFTALVLASSLERVDRKLVEQAKTLGSTASSAFWTVTLPMTGRALLGALCFTFFLSTGDFLTPAFLGGVNGTTLGAVIAAEFQQVGDYGSGAALSFIMLAMFLVFFVVVWTALRQLGILSRR